MKDLLSLHSAYDVQLALAEAIRHKRKKYKLSRQALAERSGVPAPTIKHFEQTGQISLRQFLLLWQMVDDLDVIYALTKEAEPVPQTIEDVLKQREASDEYRRIRCVSRG